MFNLQKFLYTYIQFYIGHLKT